jgi:acylglycerol lipase
VKSPADRGKTGPTETVLADMAAFINAQLPADTPNDLAGPPVFVLGYSMGGGQVAVLAGTPKYASLVKRLRGLILGAPFIGFGPGTKPNPLTVFAGRLASHLVPNFQMKNPINVTLLSRRPEIQKLYRDSPLTHDTGTLEGLAGMLDRTEALETGALRMGPQVRALLWVHGAEDKVTSPTAARNFFEKQTVQDKESKVYEGMLHILQSDIGGDEYIRDIGDWMLARAVESTGAP